MKKIFFYFMLFYALLFISCRKESKRVQNNKLVVQYPNGSVIATGLPSSGLEGTSVYDFYVYAGGRRACHSDKLLSSNFDFDFIVTKGIPPTIIFDSTGQNQGIKMTLTDSYGFVWKPRKGTAKVELDYIDPDNFPNVAQVSFNDVLFTNAPVRQDTLWVSGIVNAYHH